MKPRDRAEVEDILSKMIQEAIESHHRRLIVASGEKSSEVIRFLIFKHAEERKRFNQEGDIIYVDHEKEGGKNFKILSETLLEADFPLESIKHYVYEESGRLLGTTNDILIMDMEKGARPNDIGRLVETVRGGGLIIFHNLSLETNKSWKTSLHKSFVYPPYDWEDIKPRFERHFLKKLMEHPGIWILNGWNLLKGELLNPTKISREKPKIPEESRVPRKLLELALTKEQIMGLDLIERAIRREGKNVVLITANRGRGKSALLGLSIAMFSHFGIRRILVTAPSEEDAEIIFNMVERGLTALKRKFVKKSGEAVANIKCGRSIIEFSLPQRALRKNADILIVDEAAGIPVPILFAFTGRYRKIVFASTIHGYEGAGRGFSLRFLRALEQDKDINLSRIELKEPIRYAPEDPVEKWLYSALLLDAEPADVGAKADKIRARECIYEKIDLDQLFMKEEEKLRELIGIYVLAHYRNRPDDLLILGDAPHHLARAMITRSGEIVAGLHIAEEGRMSKELIDCVLSGNPPSGNLIPSCILKYYPSYREFAELKGLRIVRIAVHPDLVDRGIGSLLLKKICEEASGRGFDWVGASFGTDRRLLNFWLKNGFIPLHISPMRNVVSGEYSVAVVKPLNEKAEGLVRELYMEFKIRFLNSLPDTYFNLEPEVVSQLLSIDKWDALRKPQLTQAQKERLISYVRGNLVYEGTCDAVKEILISHFMSSGKHRASLDKRAEIALISRCLQCRSWDKSAEMAKMRSADLKLDLRVHVGKLLDHYMNL